MLLLFFSCSLCFVAAFLCFSLWLVYFVFFFFFFFNRIAAYVCFFFGGGGGGGEEGGGGGGGGVSSRGNVYYVHMYELPYMCG